MIRSERVLKLDKTLFFLKPLIVGFVRPSELSRHIDKKHGPQHIPPDLRHYIKAPVEKSIRGVSLNFPIHIKKKD